MATALRTPDAELVRRLRTRDRDAWEQLYAAYQPRLRGFAYRLAGNVHDADDLVQETFVRAVPRLAELDPYTADVASYLFATLRNVFLKQAERRKRAEPFAEVPEPSLPQPIEDDPERSTLLAAQQAEVRVANARLQPRQRLVLALRELEERSYAEIGELVGMKENAVAQLIFRARESLRTELRLAQVDPQRLPDECRAFLPRLAAHLDGQLRGARLDATLEHLAGCDRCQGALADMREASRRYRALPLLPADEARAATELRLDQVGFWSGRRRVRRIGRRTAIATSVVWLVALLIGGAAVADWVSRERPMLAAADTTSASEATTTAGTTAPPATTRTARRDPTTPSVTTTAPTTTAAAEPVPATTAAPRAPSTTTRSTTTTRPPTTRPTTTVVSTAPPPPPDTTPPTVRISSTPPARTTDPRAAFAFAADEEGASFRCSLDGGAEAPCSSPATYGPLGLGSHTFAVRAVDHAGNVGAQASYAWTIFERLPDLVVASLGQFAAVVANRGDAPAGASLLTITNVGTFSVPPLGPGAAATFSWSTCRSGVYTAVADRANSVRESNEANNTTSRRNTCP